MSFQFHALDADAFSHWFAMDEAELHHHGGVWMIAEQCPDLPCRISFEDAPVGERVLLINYTHQTANSPYRASHAVFVRKGVETARPPSNTVPHLLRHRLLSLRAFNTAGMIVEAEVVEGTNAEAEIKRMFENLEVADIHVHFAKPGCYAARVTRS